MSNELFKAVRYALYAGTTAVVGLSAAPVLAQDESSQQLETITVTGSNIRRVDIETSNPVITIDRASIEKSGKLTLGDLVQNLPAVTGGNTNPQVNNGGGTGFSSIGLRGLGSARTLVLINGHRYLSQDPNAIPANMIERIEVLTSGASSVYGSDAIAGVVNFILRSDYQGAEFSADYGISDKDDGASQGYSFTFGHSTDRGSIMAGINYKKIDGVLAGHRKFSENAVSASGSSTFVGGSSSSQFGHFAIPEAFAGMFPGCASGFLALNPGSSGQNIATDYHCYRNQPNENGPSDLYNYATVNLIMTPQERTGLFLNGNYKLTDNIEAYLSVMHAKTASAFQIAPGVFGNPTGANISADNYYNPFDVAFGPGEHNWGYRLASLGNRRASFGRNDDQIATGLRGSFDVWNDYQWNWEVGYDYGHTRIGTTTYGLIDGAVLADAMGPSFLLDGVVVCGTPDNVIAGCTPMNPFNLADPASVAALRGAERIASSNQYQKQTVKRIDLNGGLFELPGGTVQLAVGANYRTEYTNALVDTSLLIDFNSGNCVLGSQCGSALQGGYDVKEAYAELFIPIVKDIPFLHALNLTLGSRYSKYSTFGSTNNTKIALEWRPIEDLLLRGTVSEVFRAPTVGNVFAGAASDAPSLNFDPCDFVAPSPDTPNPNAGHPACVGVPATGSFINTAVRDNLQINGIASGSAFAGLPIGPEVGKSFDFGVVYDPSWLEGLSVSADLWRLYLNNTITAIGAQAVLDLCFAGQAQFCPLVRRFVGGPSAGQINNIIEPTGNLGRIDATGVDFELNYRLPEFSFGRFNVGLNATYLTKFDLQTAPGLSGNTVYHYGGHFMNFGSAQEAACPGSVGGTCLFPRWRAQASVGWQLGAFDAAWNMRYISGFRMGSPAESQDTLPYFVPGLYTDYGSTTYHDVQFGYNIEPINTRIDLGVNNVGDKQPPFLYANNTLNANTDPGNFDLMGRYYFGRVTVKF